MKKLLVLLLIAAAALVAAFVAGYWPQRQRLGALDAERGQLQQRLDAAEAKVRAGQLLGELLTLKETVQEMNYGQARGLSSPFFDHVRAEAGRTAEPSLKQALDGIQSLRDPVTIGLTQGDPAALNHLRDAERRLRTALGYPAPAAVAVPAPAALPSPSLVPPPGTSSPAPLPPGVSSPNPLGLPSPAPTPIP